MTYASRQQLKETVEKLKFEIPSASFTIQGRTNLKPIPHIRVQKASVTEIKTAINILGTPSAPDQIQSRMSSKFPVYSFNENNTRYTVVIGSKGNGNDTTVGIAPKELTPTSLGLAGKKFNKVELVNYTVKAVSEKIRDEKLATALISLVHNAADGGKKVLAPEPAKYIAPTIATISQDFGEILAPLILMKDKCTAEFPVGNNPIIDVKLSSANLSVKALTGSGTSFRTISGLMDQYESTIQHNQHLLDRYKVFKSFHPEAGGKNVDKIINAAATARVPEYVALTRILGEHRSYAELAAAVESKVLSTHYADFLKMVYPAMTAGNWGTPVGLPADGRYYLGQVEAKPKERSAGYPSFLANPVKGSADIITYMLGVGLLNFVRRGPDAAVFSAMITDICKQADATLAHITIEPSGAMVLATKPFSDLRFEFQYHAPSHMPGNNLPGFIATI